MKKNNNISEAGQVLVAWLRENSEDTAVMADLRRGAGKTYEESITMHRHLNALAQELGLWGWSRQVFYLTATLFVLGGKESSDNAGTLGRSAKYAEISERRFETLLTMDPSDLLNILPGMVQSITGKNVAINFARLYTDLVYWNGEYTRTSWAEAYWGSSKSNSEEKQGEQIK